MQERLLQLQSLVKNPQWISEPGNKQLAQQILERSRELFYRYEPYFNRRDGKPGWQWEFLAAANDYSGRIAVAANRTGKSDQGAYECVLAITGKHPFRKFPKIGKGWIVGLDYNMVRDINLPKFNKMLPRNFTINSDFNKSDKIWYIKGEGREWTIQFKSSDSGREKFQGDAVDFIWFDEEPSKTDIFSECMMRLIDRAGIWWMTATPVNGTAWLKAQIERDDVFDITAAMWDNPYIPLEEIKKKAAELSEDELAVRIEGKYIVFGGNPVFNIRILNKMLADMKHDIPALIGTLRETEAA
jgi:phage terminase large subunit-like protein